MSGNAKAAPLTFKAGGRGRSSAKGQGPNKVSGDHVNPRTQPSPSYGRQSTPSESNALTIVQAGLGSKPSPLQIKNWIACVLTLDGRDKFTKVLQYSSRLLAWHFAGLAARTPPGIGAPSGEAWNGAATSGGLLAAVMTGAHLRRQLYAALSQRFDALYKSLVMSRKAFRLGRSVIEWHKLKSMGWGDYLGYMLAHPLAGGVADGVPGHGEKGKEAGKGGGVGTPRRASHTLDRYDTHPIPEEGSCDEDDDDSSRGEWSAEDDDSDGSSAEEKKSDRDPSEKAKVVTRPGRPKLPSRISSNVGWGPSAASSEPSKKAPAGPLPARTVGEMDRVMYRPSPGSCRRTKEPVEKSLIEPPSPPTPAWKLVGGTIKLMGLMGFWAFDNLAFLTGSGFLDPIRLHAPPSGTSADASANPEERRLQRKRGFSERGARCYFFGVIAGLYLNARALWVHRGGALWDARDGLRKALRLSSLLVRNGDDDGEGRVDEARAHLKQTERRHFELSLALLKSCCDFMVFSNNPGIDLHLKLRGRKNHEGLHCLGGLVSAGTVLYNNFPNAK